VFSNVSTLKKIAKLLSALKACLIEMFINLKFDVVFQDT